MLQKELEDLIVFLRKGKDVLVVPNKSALYRNNVLSNDVKMIFFSLSSPPQLVDYLTNRTLFRLRLIRLALIFYVS